MSAGNQEQSQSVTKCFELREHCQRQIFEKMDQQHKAQMDTLGEIQYDLAFNKGQQEGEKKSSESGISQIKVVSESKWKEHMVRTLINWIPPILFLALLGGISWLKTKGWL